MKKILMVGNMDMLDIFKCHFEMENENRFTMHKGVSDITDAMKELNSENYWGILMNSLVIPAGPDHKKYDEALKEFAMFDHRNIWRSGGLYVVQQACKRGIHTVVNSVAEKDRVLKEAERLGATCIKDGKNMLLRDYEFFQSKL